MPKRMIVCRCDHAHVLAPEAVARVVDGLCDSGIEVLEVPDLCGAVACRDPQLVDWIGQGVGVVACHSQAVAWLLSRLTGDLGSAVRLSTACIDLRRESVADVLAACAVPAEMSGSVPDVPQHQEPAPSAPGWIPWFPVLDYDRCTGCRQCLSFCPFGVYAWEDDRVVAMAPENCKNNCPACARLCPEVAIMFPKLADAPINGAEVTPEDMARVRRALAEQGGDEGLHEILARRKLRAAYRKLEREAQQEGRELDPEELSRTLSAAIGRERHDA